MFMNLAGLIAAAIRLIQNLNSMVALGGEPDNFEEERRNILMTAIFFGSSIAIRLILTLLFVCQVITINNLGEVGSVQLEFFSCILCELIPFFFCLVLHMRNFEASKSSVNVSTNMTTNSDEKYNERDDNSDRSGSILKL